MNYGLVFGTFSETTDRAPDGSGPAVSVAVPEPATLLLLGQGGVVRVARTGLPEIFPEVTDEMLVAAARDSEHLAILKPIFDRLIKYYIHLQPKKSVFTVLSGELSGFIVSLHGIEVDPAKFKAFLEMPPPTNLRKLRSLQGKLQSIHRFIS